MARFNSDNYAFKDIQVFYGGRFIIGFRGISFEIKKELTTRYGAGDEPHSIAEGNKEYDATVKLTQAEVDAIVASVQQTKPDGDFTDAELDITVVFARRVTDPTKTHKILGWKCGSGAYGMDQGDPDMTVDLQGKALKILMNQK